VDGGQLIYLLGDGKLKELVTPEGTYTGAGDSKFMLSVLFGAATKMTDDPSAGVRRGVREVWRRGQIPGRPPIGYSKTRQGIGPKQTGRVVPDPERFAVVKRIWQEMAIGNRTVAQIWRRAVREWGFRTETGRRPTTTILYKLLRNPFYMGFIATPEGLFKGEHVPMVTRDEFDRVQKAITRQGTARAVRHDFVYRCFLVCGRCGRRYVGERITKPSGLVFTYYRCGRKRQEYKRCLTTGIREDTITAAIETDFGCLVLPAKTAVWLRSAVEEWATAREGGIAEHVQALEKQLRQVEAERARLTDLVARGVLPEEDFVARRGEVQSRLEELRAGLAEPGAALRTSRAALTQALVEGATLLDAFREGTNDARRDLLARVYYNPTVTDANIKLALRFPFTLLVRARELAPSAERGDYNPVLVVDSLLNQTENAPS
jgi:site-specific DNA recombinase